MTTEEKLKEMLGDYYEMGVPGSPNAAILQNMLGADNELRDPQSENEALLKLIYEDVIGAVYDARDEAQEAAAQAGTAAEAVANKAPAITDTASGPIASFPDGADGMPLKSLVIDIDPVQDLHGYDNPWPAGGGKNLYNPADSEVGKLLDTDTGGLIDSSSYWTSGYIPVDAETTYVRSSTGSSRVCYYDSTKAFVSNVGWTSGSKTTPSGVAYVRFSGSTSSVAYNGQVQFEKGSTISAYSPYENICPISGHTGANVTAAGKNLLPNKKAQNTSTRVLLGTDTDSIVQYFYIPAGTYRLSVTMTDGSTPPTPFWRLGESGEINQSNTITVPENNHEKLRIWLFDGDGISVDDIKTFQLEPGSTATTYEPYHGATKSISFPSTIYGGTDEVVSGSGVNRMDLVDLSELSWNMVTEDNTDDFRARVLSYNTPDGGWSGDWNNTKSNCFVNVNPGVSYANRPFYSFCNIPQNYYNFNVKVPTGAFADAAAFKTWLANIDGNNTHAVVVIDKLTNAAFSTTPVTDLVTQYGQNNIFADCGPVDVEYRADTKLYIKRLTGPTDDDMTADANIAAGTYFMVGNNLFLSTASIAAGEAIVPGTNCTATNLAAALNALQ